MIDYTKLDLTELDMLEDKFPNLVCREALRRLRYIYDKSTSFNDPDKLLVCRVMDGEY